MWVNRLDETTMRETASIVAELGDIVPLVKFCVVGSYVRYDNAVLNSLKVVKQRIIAQLETPTGGQENYLIWGPPGSGKSYFVQQIAKSLGDAVYYKELNLTKLDEQSFRRNLSELEDIRKPLLCFIDEIDSRLSESWPYEALLTSLGPPVPRSSSVCFVLAGSRGSDIEEMKRLISKQEKGPDLLDRVQANQCVVKLLGLGDKLIVALRQMINAAKEKGFRVQGVEKLALLYVALNPEISSARLLREKISNCVKQLPKGEDMIKYDYFFGAGEEERYKFKTVAQSLVPELVNSFITVQDYQTEAPKHAPASKVPSAVMLRNRLTGDRKRLDFSSLLALCKKQVTQEIKFLRGSSEERSKKYIPELYVKREEIEKEFSEFLDQQEKNGCVIVGEAGIGKTNLLCHLAETIVESRPALFVNSLYVNKPLEEYLVAIFQDLTGTKLEFSDLIAGLTNILDERNMDLVVFVDAMNESPDPMRMKTDLANIVDKSLGKRVRFYMSCRDMDWEFFLKNNDKLLDCLYSRRGRVFLRNDLKFEKFSAKEFKTAWKLYKRMYVIRGSLCKELKNICMHPLMLRFLAEGFENEKLPTDVRRIEIFDKYWMTKLEHTGGRDRATRYMFAIVKELEKKKRSDLLKTELIMLLNDTTDTLQTILSKILSENLIVYLNWSGERVVGFAYEAFLEYVMARWIMYGKPYSWDAKESGRILVDLRKFLKEAEEYRTMKGTIQYLVMMNEGKKGDIHVLMLKELLVKCDPTWDSFVIGVSSKLKEPKKILDVVGELSGRGDLRIYALRALGDIGSDQAIKYLTKSLRDKDDDVYREALDSLVRIGSTRAIKALISALLYSDNLALKYSIVRNIAKMKSSRAVSYLLDAGAKCDDFAKKYIIEALGELRDSAAIGFLMDASINIDDSIVALAVDALGKVVSSNPTIKDDEREKVVDTLIVLLGHKDEFVKMCAVDGLGLIGSEKCVRPLLQLLGSESEHVKRRAVEVLGMIGNKEVISPVIDMLNADDNSTKNAAVTALKMIGDQNLIPYLAGALSAGRLSTSQNLCDAFRTMGTELSIHALLKEVKQGNCINMKGVVKVIGSLRSDFGIEPLVRLLSRSCSCEREVIDAIARIGGRKATESLLGLLHRDDKRIKLHAIEALGVLKAEEAIPSLLKLLKSTDSDISVQSILAIGKIGEPRTLDSLVNISQCGNSSVRCAVAKALASIGGEKRRDVLAAMLNDTEDVVRQAAADSLGASCDPRMASILLGRLNVESNQSVLLSIIRALGEARNAIATLPLLNLLEKRKVGMREIENSAGLLEADEYARKGRIYGLIGENAKIVREIIIALGKIGNPRASDTIKEFAQGSLELGMVDEEHWSENNDFHLEAVEALAEIGGKVAFDTLNDVLRKPARRFTHKDTEETKREMYYKYQRRIRKTASKSLIRMIGKETDI